MPQSITRLTFTILIILALIQVIPAQARAENTRQTLVIQDVSFTGINNLSKKELIQTLAVRDRPAWRFFGAKPTATRQDLEDDLLRIRQYYRDRGYYKARAQYHIVKSRPDSCYLQAAPQAEDDTEMARQNNERACRVWVVFEVLEGPPVVIDHIEWEFTDFSSQVCPDMFTKHLRLKKGQVFNTADYEEAKEKIRELLGRQGYPFASVQGRVRVELFLNTARIIFKIDPKKKYGFGRIHFTGHKGIVDEKTLERALVFKSGQRYDSGKIDVSRRNLFDLNTFQSAVIRPQKPENHDKEVDIHVEVKPRKNQSVELGAGYGSEDGLRLQGAWRYRNLTGNADRFSLLAKRSDLLENIEGQYQWPYLWSRKNTLHIKSGYERQDDQYYRLQRGFATASVKHRLSGHWTVTPYYSLMTNRPDRIAQSIPEAEWSREKGTDYLISAVKLAVDRIKVDDELNPRKGTVFELSMEAAGSALGSEIDYYQPKIEAKAYMPVYGKVILAARVRIQAIEEIKDTQHLPIFLKQFLGGSKTVRGYQYQQLNIYDKQDQLIAIGGKTSFCSNLEMRFPVYKKLTGVAFIDMGMLNADSFSLEINQMRYTIGIGARFNTVIGPVQIDLGYKLNPPRGSLIETESADTSPWGLHINIGHAF